MYAIFLKKKDDKKWLPIAYSQQVENIKQARKYRKIELALRDYAQCLTNYPEFAWSIRCLKTNFSLYNNLKDIIVKWRIQPRIAQKRGQHDHLTRRHNLL